MNTVTADSSFEKSLVNLTGLTVVCDSQGAILGYFSPASHNSPEAYAQAATHFDPEEMKRRKSSNKRGHTTEKVLNRMPNMEK